MKNKPSPDAAEIEKTLNTLFAREDIVELRIINKKGRTRIDAGYFDGDHHEELIQAAVRANKQGNNVYVVMNTVDKQLHTRYYNRMEEWAEDTTTDINITRRRWLLIDIDPERPKGTAATEDQYQCAKQVAFEVKSFLHYLGWPSPVIAGSGNGVHFLYRIDLPADSTAYELIKSVLATLGTRFGTAKAKVDLSVVNAAQITKLYGTVSTKGDHTDLTPWRLSKISKIPKVLEIVTADQMEELASLQPEPVTTLTAAQLNSDAVSGIVFELESFLTRLGIPHTQDQHDGRDRFKLEHCPFNPEHGKGEAAIFRSADGLLGFKCFHNSCADKHWRDVRALVDGDVGGDAKSPKQDGETPLLFDEISTPEITAELLPGWLGDHVDAVARSTQTPSVMGVMISLSTVATCTAKRFEVGPSSTGYSEPLNLWTATAMPPGSRKTAVIEAMTAPLVEWENQQASLLALEIETTNSQRRVIEQQIKNLERAAGSRKTEPEDRLDILKEISKLTSEMPPEILLPRLWTGDTTPERLQGLLAEQEGRMAVLADEGGIFEVMSGLYSDGKANLDVFLKGHAGSAVRVDRQSRTALVDKPALTFGLAIQPAILAEMANGGKKRFRGNGTLARFLYALPSSNIGSRDVRQVYQVPESVKASYQTGLFELLQIPPQFIDGREEPRRLSLSPEALECWHDFSEKIEGCQGEGGDLETISDWSAKLPGAALRIAGNLHLVEYGSSPPSEIRAATIQRSIELCTLLIDHAKAAFAQMDADQAISDAKAILRWITTTRLKQFRRGEAYRRFKSRFTGRTERMDKALQELSRRAILAVKTETTNGRTATVYIVSDAIWEAA